MIHDESDEALRQLLQHQPDLEYFYLLWSNFSAGSTGYTMFHSLALDPSTCRTAIQELCAEQKRDRDATLAGLADVPEDEEPYDPVIPDGCSVALCLVLPDRHHYVSIQGQRWNNQGQTHHSELIPDIFDLAYYRNKVQQGDYHRSQVKALPSGYSSSL